MSVNKVKKSNPLEKSSIILCLVIAFIITPITAADLRTDRIIAIAQFNKDVYDDLMKKIFYSFAYMKSSWISFSANVRKILTRIKGNDAKAILQALNNGNALSFVMKNENANDPVIEIIMEVPQQQQQRDDDYNDKGRNNTMIETSHYN